MLLVIDSATAACSVALIDGDRLVDERHAVVGRGHAEHLLPMIESLLGTRRPAAIAVDCGPGSFTGLRVGLAAAHGLAIGWQVPLSGYSSLAVIAAAAPPAERGTGDGGDDQVALDVELAQVALGHGDQFRLGKSADANRPIRGEDLQQACKVRVTHRMIESRAPGETPGET